MHNYIYDFLKNRLIDKIIYKCNKSIEYRNINKLLLLNFNIKLKCFLANVS
jgi:hypothetical protein